MQHLILTAFVSLCMFLSTYAQEKKMEHKDQFNITGNIIGLGTGQIILKYEYLNTVVYDTTQMENGMFSFLGKLERPSYSQLLTPDNKFSHGQFLENAEIQITGMIKNSGSWVKVTGSATDAEYRTFKNLFVSMNDQAKTLEKQILELKKADSIAAEKISRMELGALLNQIKLKKLDYF